MGGGGGWGTEIPRELGIDSWGAMEGRDSASMEMVGTQVPEPVGVGGGRGRTGH